MLKYDCNQRFLLQLIDHSCHYLTANMSTFSHDFVCEDVHMCKPV